MYIFIHRKAICLGYLKPRTVVEKFDAAIVSRFVGSLFFVKQRISHHDRTEAVRYNVQFFSSSISISDLYIFRTYLADLDEQTLYKLSSLTLLCDRS